MTLIQPFYSVTTDRQLSGTAHEAIQQVIKLATCLEFIDWAACIQVSRCRKRHIWAIILEPCYCITRLNQCTALGSLYNLPALSCSQLQVCATSIVTYQQVAITPGDGESRDKKCLRDKLSPNLSTL
jgi:hypothetical protein